MDRVSKHNYYLDIAQTVAERSTCLRKMYGAIIVKKAKVIVAVGIYYAGNLSFAIIYRIVSICMMYGFGGGGVNLDAISEREWYFVIFLLLLLISLIIAAASMALYLFTQNRLERKLNLA